MMIYIVPSMSQKLCTPPQTSAKLLTLDITETAITVIDITIVTGMDIKSNYQKRKIL